MNMHPNIFIMPSILAALFVPATDAMAQSVTFETDALQRGYYDRPYLRYEAEPGLCIQSGGSFIEATPYRQDELASEASNLKAVTLNGKGSYIAWTLDGDANALSIRFSLPDSESGFGTKCKIGIYKGEDRIAESTLDSYWAWQYTTKANVGEKYPDNIPSDSKFARMRFDETYLLLHQAVEKDELLKIVVEDDNNEVTIDFVEAEMAAPAMTFAEITSAPHDWEIIEFQGEGKSLQGFINANPGKTIFIPAGTYDVPSGLEIKADGTRLTGAGMWHTVINFTASSDNIRTYGRRGITCDRNDCGVSDLSLQTVNNKRYYDNNSSYQVGKAFMGSWGQNSVISNVRADHFECGAWIADYNGNSSRNLQVTNCRFRNNYADGINLCSGTEGAIVSHCSFRNNGDDDQAIWSTGNFSRNNTYCYNTAENNWRASSLGFFGGEGNHAHNIAIFDAMECGARINGVFNGTGFGENISSFENISIYRAGCGRESCGIQGDFWGNPNPALWIIGGNLYNTRNILLTDININDSRFEGVRLQCNGGKLIENITMLNIHVDGVTDDGRAFNFQTSTRGNGTGENLTYDNITNEEPITAIPRLFDFNLNSGVGAVQTTDHIPVSICGNQVMLLDNGDYDNTQVSCCPEHLFIDFFDMAGAMAGRLSPASPILSLSSGCYMARDNKGACFKMAIR